MTVSTPLRDLPAQAPLPATNPSPLAQSLRTALDSTADLSSWSDELAAQGTSWPASYFLAPSRANVLRGLPLAGRDVVLEIGSRAGALTRYLGEEFVLVDGLEPDPEMAELARTRCADLPGVAVHPCWIDQVPAEAVYDLIVAVDVTAELSSRAMKLEEFLSECRARLRPDGVIVLCADNADGVRLAGGAGLPEPGIVSTSRPVRVTADELANAVDATGLRAWTGSAFPDHRGTQLLFDHDALAALDDRLLLALPAFPSPAYGTATPVPDAEAAAWQAAVSSGRSALRANSFVALISAAPPVPVDAAVYWSRGRSASLSACNRIRLQDGAPVVDREAAFPRAPEQPWPLRMRPHVEPFVRGRSLVALLRDAPDSRAAQQLLLRWTAVLRRPAFDGQVPWDLIPRNIVIDDANEAHAIDQEWALDGSTFEVVLRRGCFWSAVDLLGGNGRPPWLRGTTVGQVADFIMRLAVGHVETDWLDMFVRAEAAATSYITALGPLQTRQYFEQQNGKTLTAMSQSTPDSSGHGAEEHDHSTDTSESLQLVIDSLLQTNEELRARVRELELQRRHDALTQRDHAIGLTSELEVMRDRVGRTQAAQKLAMTKVRRLREQVASMESSTTWRIGRFFVAPLARLRGRR